MEVRICLINLAAIINQCLKIIVELLIRLLVYLCFQLQFKKWMVKIRLEGINKSKILRLLGQLFGNEKNVIAKLEI